MRSVRPTVAAVALLLVAPAAAAQAPECDAYAAVPRAERVCSAAVDGTRAFHPVAGLLVSGGNPVLGSGASLGGFPHFAVTLRANGTRLVLPDLDYDGTSSEVAKDEDLFAPAPLVEAALGVWRGGRGGAFAVDLLASAQLLPTDAVDNLSIDDDARSIGDVALGLGIGARVQILPGVAVSVMRRGLPEIRYGDLAGGDDYSYAVDLQATNVRATAGRRFSVLTVAGGLGWDKYTGDATIAFRNPVTSLPEAPIELELDQTRWMGFLDAGLDLSFVTLAGELGYQLGRDQELSTDFEDFDTDGGRFFAGVGLRFGF